MSIYEDKHRLFAEYIKEIDESNPSPFPRNPESVRALCDRYISSKDCTWKNLFDPESKKLVGFIIIGKSGVEKHPDSMRSIEEAYVEPAYRRRGLASDCIRDYETRHHGVFSILVFKNNEYALRFWPNLFHAMGYKSIELDNDIVDRLLQDKTVLLGFAPK